MIFRGGEYIVYLLMDCLIFEFLFLKYVSCFILDMAICGKVFFPEHCVTSKLILCVH